MGNVQIGVANADYNIFLNAMKGAGRWQNISGGTFDVSTVDSDGYPTSVPAGGVVSTVPIPGSGYSRNYRLYWDGVQGTVSSSGTLLSGSYVSGCQVDCGATTTPRSLGVKILTVTGADYPRNFRLLADNSRDITLFTGGQNYTPEAVSILSNASVLRLMDFQAGAANGGNLTVVDWADRKPSTYYTYLQYYWPPGKIVPAANVSFDGVSKYTVTWTGQSGALTDKFQFIALVPSAGSGLTTTNLNGTGDLPNTDYSGQPRNSLPNVWALWTYDKALNRWLIDTTAAGGLSMGAPIEVCVDMCNYLNVPPWLVAGAYWGDVNEGVSTFPSGVATYLKNNLTTSAPPVFECGPNETGNNGGPNVQTFYAYNAQLAHNGAGSDIYGVFGVTTGASTVLTIGAHTFSVGSIVQWANISQQGVSFADGSGAVTATTSTSITVATASSGTFAFNGGAGFVSKGYAVTGALSGATTTLTVGTHAFEIGSLVAVSAVGGLTGASGSARVLSTTSTTITVNLTSTGSYTSGGKVLPATFDANNWYGLVANNIGAAIATVYGIGNKGTTYRTFCGLLTFIGNASTGTNAGQDTKLTSPFITTRGGQATHTYMTEFGGASYIQPSYLASTATMTIAEGQLAFEYTNATAARKLSILNEYVSSCWDSYNPVAITGITPGNPTILTVDSTKRLRVYDSESITITGVTGDIGAVLNRGPMSATSFTYSPSFTTTAKTDTTITINVDTTGKVYSGGGTVTPPSSAAVTATHVYGDVFPAYVAAFAAYNLKFSNYEGGIGPDRMTSDSSVTIKNLQSIGAATKITIGANSWNKLYNVLGVTGLKATISGIPASTLATLLNSTSPVVTAADETSITINVDTSGVSAWASGGSVTYFGSKDAVNVLRNNLNFCPSAYDVTARAHAAFVALGSNYHTPSDFVLTGSNNFSMFQSDFISSLSTAYRYQAAKNCFLNKRRIHW